MADYTREQLMQALRKADAAGDTAAAKAIATRIKGIQAAPAAAGAPAPAGAPAAPGVQGDQIRAAYEALPWYQKIPQAADDVIRLGAEGITFGGADKLSAGMGTLFGGDYDKALEEERKKTAAARERAGSAGVAAEVGGAIAGPGKISALGLIPKSAPKLLKLAAVPTIGASEGVIANELSNQGHDTQGNQGLSAAVGAGGAVAAPILSRLLGAVGGFLTPKPRVPTTPQLAAAKNAAYDAAHNSGAGYSESRVRKMLMDAQRDMSVEGLDPELHKNATRVLGMAHDRLAQPGVKSLSDLDKMRQIISREVDGTAGERNMRRIFTGKVDEVLDNPDFGPASPLLDARAANRRFKQSEQLDDVEYRAENSNTTARAGVRSILNNPRRMRGNTPQVREAMENVSRGGPLNRTADKIRAVAPLARVPAMGIGATVGGIPGAAAGWAAPSAVHLAANALDRVGTRGSMKRLRRAATDTSVAPNIMQRGDMDPYLAKAFLGYYLSGEE